MRKPDFIEKTIMLNGNRVKAKVPRKLTPEEREKALRDFINDIKELVESQKAA